MIVNHGDKRYRVLDPVANAATYHLYLCEEEESGRSLLLQIAAETADSGGLERTAYLLKELKRSADDYQAKFTKLGHEGLLSYDRLFPQLVDGFRADEAQGGRRINVLAFTEVDDVTAMVPLSNLRDRDRRRVELTSSAWIMGRLLKLLAFTHEQGISVGDLSRNNILLEPDRHFAVVFDWAKALSYAKSVPRGVQNAELAVAAKSVFTAIGGDVGSGNYPYDADEAKRYVDFVRKLAQGTTRNAQRAHDEFYELVDELWGRSFRPFQTLPL